MNIHICSYVYMHIHIYVYTQISEYSYISDLTHTLAELHLGDIAQVTLENPEDFRVFPTAVSGFEFRKAEKN